MKIIDAHSHLDYISHNFQSDVVGTICCTTKESEWGILIEKMLEDKNLYAAFGIHPWFVDTVQDGFDKRLKDLLISNNSLIVGEIGLDKYKPDMDKQICVFTKQLDIAVKLHRTVFLHCVGAWDKVLHILKKYKASDLPILVAHDFNGSSEILDSLIKNYNVFFSFNKIDKSQEINRIQRIPIKNILIETDAKKDIVLRDLVYKISDIKKEDNIENIIYENTLKVMQNG